MVIIYVNRKIFNSCKLAHSIFKEYNNTRAVNKFIINGPLVKALYLMKQSTVFGICVTYNIILY